MKITDARNIFIIVIIFHCINSLLWFKNDGYAIVGSHAVWHEKNSFKYSEVLLDNRTSTLQKVLNTLDFFKLSRHDHTFTITNFNLTSFFLAFPISPYLNGHTKLFLINSFVFLQFLLVLLALYYLGKTLFNQTIGAWSSIIFSFYPGILGLSRKANCELMVTFFVILSIIVFLRWRHLPKILRLFLLLSIFILGIFSGGLFLVFFIPLFLLHVFYDFLTSKNKKQSLIYSIVFLFFILVFFNFYFDGEYLKVFQNFKEPFDEAYQKLFFYSSDFIGSASNGIVGSFFFAPQDSICLCTQTTNVGMNIKTFFFYIAEMIYYSSALFFLLGVCSFFFLLRDKRVDFHKKMFFGAWVIFSYLLLTLFHIKWGKFITPMLPVLALSSSVFICGQFKKLKIKKTIIFCLGISTVLYYSYFSYPHRHFLEKVSEGIISHRPFKSRFVYVGEQVATKINNYDMSKTTDAVYIAFLDKESSRYQGVWLADLSVRVENLIRVFLRRKFRIKNFWRLSDDFYDTLHNQDFVVLITQKKIKEVESYLYPKETAKIPGLKFKIAYEDWLKQDVFIYLIRILKF